MSKIDAEHKLPCDFIVGYVRFRNGVKLETIRAAAERWFSVASLASYNPALRTAAEAVIKDYPAAAGTTGALSEEEPGYGSIKRLKKVLEQMPPTIGEFTVDYSPLSEAEISQPSGAEQMLAASTDSSREDKS